MLGAAEGGEVGVAGETEGRRRGRRIMRRERLQGGERGAGGLFLEAFEEHVDVTGAMKII